MTKSWKVYRIQFEDDGATYIGITHRTLEARLAHHATHYKNYPGQAGNAELNARLRAGDHYYARVIAEFKNKADAQQRELLEIRKEPRPINIYGTNLPQKVKYMIKDGKPRKTIWPKKKRNKARKKGSYQCGWCKEIKDAADFGSDCTRYNGLNSRCRECTSAYRRAIYHARKNGENVSREYYRIKAELNVKHAP